MLTTGGLRTGIQKLLNFLTHKLTQIILQTFFPSFSVQCTACMDYFVAYLANEKRHFNNKWLQVHENKSPSHTLFQSLFLGWKDMFIKINQKSILLYFLCFL